MKTLTIPGKNALRILQKDLPLIDRPFTAIADTSGLTTVQLIDLLKIAKDQKDLVHEGARCGRKDTGVIVGAAERLVIRACELLALPGIAPPEPTPEEPVD